eukprot:TRINITY_DN1841_c0_g1_i2.p1 TRINITY_DN1841_c0_g1~~TRINITY_DN1841_c0_g1_i2.p1  ORF type:complete len:151 (-),score=20.66 TRINITY_DN1841_c0_g1_i2:232-651(-)
MKHVLAFGASLTEGYHNGGYDFHPYTIRLEQLLKTKGEFMVWNYGISGQTTKDMIQRLPNIFKEKGSNFFSAAIILGGTNDLWERTPEKTIVNLYKLHSIMISNGLISFAVTLPELKFEGDPEFKWLTETRNIVNHQLM